MTHINLNPRFALSQKTKSYEKKCGISKSNNSGNLRKSRKKEAYDDTFIVHKYRNTN